MISAIIYKRMMVIFFPRKAHLDVYRRAYRMMLNNLLDIEIIKIIKIIISMGEEELYRAI